MYNPQGGLLREFQEVVHNTDSSTIQSAKIIGDQLVVAYSSQSPMARWFRFHDVSTGEFLSEKQLGHSNHHYTVIPESGRIVFHSVLNDQINLYTPSDVSTFPGELSHEFQGVPIHLPPYQPVPGTNKVLSASGYLFEAGENEIALTSVFEAYVHAAFLENGKIVFLRKEGSNQSRVGLYSLENLLTPDSELVLSGRYDHVFPHGNTLSLFRKISDGDNGGWVVTSLPLEDLLPYTPPHAETPGPTGTFWNSRINDSSLGLVPDALSIVPTGSETLLFRENIQRAAYSRNALYPYDMARKDFHPTIPLFKDTRELLHIPSKNRLLLFYSDKVTAVDFDANDPAERLVVRAPYGGSFGPPVQTGDAFRVVLRYPGTTDFSVLSFDLDGRFLRSQRPNQFLDARPNFWSPSLNRFYQEYSGYLRYWPVDGEGVFGGMVSQPSGFERFPFSASYSINTALDGRIVADNGKIIHADLNEILGALPHEDYAGVAWVQNQILTRRRDAQNTDLFHYETHDQNGALIHGATFPFSMVFTHKQDGRYFFRRGLNLVILDGDLRMVYHSNDNPPPERPTLSGVLFPAGGEGGEITLDLNPGRHDGPVSFGLLEGHDFLEAHEDRLYVHTFPDLGDKGYLFFPVTIETTDRRGRKLISSHYLLFRDPDIPPGPKPAPAVPPDHADRSFTCPWGRVYFWGPGDNHVYRWCALENVFLESIPLLDTPGQVVHAKLENALYVVYPGNEVSKIYMHDTHTEEVAWHAFDGPVENIAVAGRLLICSLLGDTPRMITLDANGEVHNRIQSPASSRVLDGPGGGFVWLPGIGAHVLLYYPQAGATPDFLVYRNTFANFSLTLPQFSAPPHRFSPDARHVVDGYGQVMSRQGSQYVVENYAPLPFVDAVWLGDILYVLYEEPEEGTRLEAWENLQPASTLFLPGKPRGMHAMNNALQVVTVENQTTRVTTVCPDHAVNPGVRVQLLPVLPQPDPGWATWDVLLSNEVPLGAFSFELDYPESLVSEPGVLPPEPFMEALAWERLPPHSLSVAFTAAGEGLEPGTRHVGRVAFRENPSIGNLRVRLAARNLQVSGPTGTPPGTEAVWFAGDQWTTMRTRRFDLNNNHRGDIGDVVLMARLLEEDLAVHPTAQSVLDLTGLGHIDAEDLRLLTGLVLGTFQPDFYLTSGDPLPAIGAGPLDANNHVSFQNQRHVADADTVVELVLAVHLQDIQPAGIHLELHYPDEALSLEPEDGVTGLGPLHALPGPQPNPVHKQLRRPFGDSYRVNRHGILAAGTEPWDGGNGNVLRFRFRLRDTAGSDDWAVFARNIEVSDLDGRVYRLPDVQAVVSTSPEPNASYRTWSSHHLPASARDRSPLERAFHDAWPNFYRFAMGMDDPASPPQPGLFVRALPDGSASAVPGFGILLPKNREGVSIGLETSRDLQTWFRVPPERLGREERPADDNHALMIFFDTQREEDPPMEFFRLRLAPDPVILP